MSVWETEKVYDMAKISFPSRTFDTHFLLFHVNLVTYEHGSVNWDSESKVRNHGKIQDYCLSSRNATSLDKDSFLAAN